VVMVSGNLELDISRTAGAAVNHAEPNSAQLYCDCATRTRIA
jgi:hypothetical protein